MFLNEEKFAKKYSKILIENIFDNNKQQTLLYFPIKYSNLENYYQCLEFCFDRLIFWFNDKNEIKKILTKHQKNNKDQQSLLHFSTQFSFENSFKLFLNYIDKDVVDINGETCLFISSKNNDTEFYNFLINEIKIDNNIKNIQNNTASFYLKN
jgi:ankyrin repeat protein